MRSAKPLTALAAVALLCGACATSTVATPAAGCSTLVDETAWEATPSAPFPAVGDVVGATVDEELALANADLEEQRVFGVRQTGQLQLSNTDKRYIRTTITKCEARDAAAARHINAPFWAFWR